MDKVTEAYNNLYHHLKRQPRGRRNRGLLSSIRGALLSRVESMFLSTSGSASVAIQSLSSELQLEEGMVKTFLTKT